MNKQTFKTWYFAKQAKKLKEVNGTSLKNRLEKDAEKAFEEHEAETKKAETLAKKTKKAETKKVEAIK